MTWHRKTGVVTVTEGRIAPLTARLGEAGVVALVESRGAGVESVHVALAVDADGRVATWAGGQIKAGAALADVAADLADHVAAEVSIGEETWAGTEDKRRGTDPFEQVLGADIAAFADRAVVFTRAPADDLTDIATQIEDDIYALPHGGGHALLITEGPILTSLDWSPQTRPLLIVEYGAGDPVLTVIGEGEAHVYAWEATRVRTPAGSDPALAAFAEATLGTGALVRGIMRTFPAAEPQGLRRALAEGAGAVVAALGLPAALMAFLTGAVAAADVEGAEEIHPASFAHSVRRAVTDASHSMTERAEAVRQRAVAVRTRAETAFDAAEAFAEEVVIPVRQNWVSPALAVAETTLGVLALRRARRGGGAGAGAAGGGG